jgi:Domain of unknown function (DUF4232)
MPDNFATMLSDIAKAGAAAGPLKPAFLVRRRGDQRRNRQRAAAGLLLVAVVGIALAIGSTIGVNRGADKSPTSTASPATPTVNPTITASASNPTNPLPDGSPSISSSPSTAGQGNGIQACRAGDLSGRVYGGQGFHGRALVAIELANTSSHPCRLFGYVGLQFVDDNGAALPTTVVRTGNQGPRFTIAPGGKGYFEVTLEHVPLPGEGAPCQPPATALFVTPPNDTGHLTIGGVWMACEHGRVETTALVDHPDSNLAPVPGQ